MYEPKVIVNGKKVPGLTGLIPGPEPLFGEGTGREAMDGHFSGTFIGYFTTLEMQFASVSDSEFNTIKQLLEHPYLSNVQFALEKDMGSYKQGDLFTEDFYNGQAIKSSPKPCGDSWEPFTVVLSAIDGRPQKSLLM